MDALNITKVIAAIITIIIPFIIGIHVFILNRTNWLNRWFSLFFVSSSLGFLFYTTYHLITNNASIIIPLMITGQFFFNFICISLLMTVFVLEKFAKVAMSSKYLIAMLILFITMSFGYLIWTPVLDTVSYSIGIVNTETPLGLQIFVNVLRISIYTYAVYKYILMAKKLEGDSKRRIQWFSAGIIIVVIGLFLNLSGGALASILLEILALITIDIGSVVLFKGFLI
ncbi:MAG: hypothetical protein ACTSRT_13590 [Promethearchaeota archaeon]